MAKNKKKPKQEKKGELCQRCYAPMCCKIVYIQDVNSCTHPRGQAITLVEFDQDLLTSAVKYLALAS